MSDSPMDSKEGPDSPTDLMDETSEHVQVSTDVVEQVSSLGSSGNEIKVAKMEIAETNATPVNLQSCTLNLDTNSKVIEPDASCETLSNISLNASPSIEEAARNLDPDESKILPPINPPLDFSEDYFRGLEGLALQIAIRQLALRPAGFSNLLIEEVKADYKTECENFDREHRESPEFKYLKVAEELEEKDYQGNDFPRPILNPTVEHYKNFVKAKAFLQVKYSSFIIPNLARNVQEFSSSFNARVPKSAAKPHIETGDMRKRPSMQTLVCEHWAVGDVLSIHTLRMLCLFTSADDDSETQLSNYIYALAVLYQFLTNRMFFIQQELKDPVVRKNYEPFRLVSKSLTDNILGLQGVIRNFLSYFNQ